jgi:flagellar brake protein
METTSIMEHATLDVLEPAPATDGGESLIRSRNEIRCILDLIRDEKIALSVQIAGMPSFATTSLIFVDDSSETLLMTCPIEWRNALETPTAERTMLSCTCDHAGTQFLTGHCTLVNLDGAPVVAIAIPEFMWRFQRRRDMRFKPQADLALKITLNLGFSEIEAEVADLSMSGIGAVHCDGDVYFDKGEVLCGCSIALPGIGKIAVDLMVQNQTAVMVPGGGNASRVGCQFIGLSEESRNLIGAYLAALADAA